MSDYLLEVEYELKKTGEKERHMKGRKNADWNKNWRWKEIKDKEIESQRNIINDESEEERASI